MSDTNPDYFGPAIGAAFKIPASFALGLLSGLSGVAWAQDVIGNHTIALPIPPELAGFGPYGVGGVVLWISHRALKLVEEVWAAHRDGGCVFPAIQVKLEHSGTVKSDDDHEVKP